MSIPKALSTAKAISITGFLSEVPAEYRDFMSKIHEDLTNDGYKQKIEQRKTGLFATYSEAKTKRILIEFYFRKNVFSMYLYVTIFNEYGGHLDNLPICIIEEIDKFTDCRRCNPGCSTPKFSINDKQYQKCRYGRINTALNPETIRILSIFN